VRETGGIVTLLFGFGLEIAIPPFSLPYGIHELTISITRTKETVRVSSAIEVIPSPLEIVMIGGNATAAIDNVDGIVVNASLSYDPDESTDHSLLFSWT
jgi:hypothetical protein